MYKIYQVQSGDTLESISRNLGITPNALIELNGLTNQTLIPGTYLVIPQTSTMFTKYIVQKGDNIYDIARRYNVSPEQLLLLNGLNKTDIIYPEQGILIPNSNISMYITKDNDTLNDVSKNLKTSVSNIASQNDQIFLIPDQLIAVRKDSLI